MEMEGLTDGGVMTIVFDIQAYKTWNVANLVVVLPLDEDFGHEIQALHHTLTSESEQVSSLGTEGGSQGITLPGWKKYERHIVVELGQRVTQQTLHQQQTGQGGSFSCVLMCACVRARARARVCVYPSESFCWTSP